MLCEGFAIIKYWERYLYQVQRNEASRSARASDRQSFLLFSLSQILYEFQHLGKVRTRLFVTHAAAEFSPTVRLDRVKYRDPALSRK